MNLCAVTAVMQSARAEYVVVTVQHGFAVRIVQIIYCGEISIQFS